MSTPGLWMHLHTLLEVSSESQTSHIMQQVSRRRFIGRGSWERREGERGSRENETFTISMAHVQRDMWHGPAHVQKDRHRNYAVASSDTIDDWFHQQVPWELDVKMLGCHEVTSSCPWMCLIANTHIHLNTPTQKHCARWFYVNLTQAKVIWEQGTSIRKMPS
jgi:hypothetical protein